MVPFVGNLTWKALKRVTTLDDPERELLMSIVGTVIYYSTIRTAIRTFMRPRSPASPTCSTGRAMPAAASWSGTS